MNRSLRPQILASLILDAEGTIAKAKSNIEIYLQNPVGIGEHPDVLAAIQEQLDVIAEQEERIDVLNNHFIDPTD